MYGQSALFFTEPKKEKYENLSTYVGLPGKREAANA